MAEPAPASTLRLAIRLQPRATRNRIVGWHGDALKIQVHAPPVEGAANAALIELLAETLAVPRYTIRILQGSASRSKLVEVSGVDAAACRRRLDAVLEPCVDKSGGGR